MSEREAHAPVHEEAVRKICRRVVKRGGDDNTQRTNVKSKTEVDGAKEEKDETTHYCLQRTIAKSNSRVEIQGSQIWLFGPGTR